MGDYIAPFRARLEAAGVRELVEWDAYSDEDRVTMWGLCRVCRGIQASCLTIKRGDNDEVHVRHELRCTSCDVPETVSDTRNDEGV